MNKIILFLTIFWTHISMASFYDYKAEGWYWFEEKNKDEDEVKTEQLIEEQKLTPKQRMEAMQKKLEEKKIRAMIEPTEVNVKDYIIEQKFVTEQAHNFSKVWQKVILKNPELDENLTNPASQMGRQVLYAKQEQEEKQKLLELSKSHGLIYFYGGKCVYCHSFSPIVKNFANRYGFEVMAITMDNVISQDFLNSKKNNGIARNLNISSWPILLALNSKTGEVIPIANGLVSETDMISNIMLLTREE